MLLVDADLHCPSLHSFFGRAQQSGLAEELTTGSPAVAHASEEVQGLSMIWAGNADSTATWNAANLLGSRRMDEMVEMWRAQYDVVVLDSAPVLAVPDAVSLARLCDRTVLVVRYEATAMSAAQRSYRMIERNLPEHAEIDVVMNGVPADSPDYIAYYGYRGSGYGRRGRADA